MDPHGPILPAGDSGRNTPTPWYSCGFDHPINCQRTPAGWPGATEECMPTVRKFRVVPNLPDRLLPLSILARNLWWTWNPDAADLFRRMDSDLWDKNHHNPVDLLGTLSQERLENLAGDEAFLANLDRIVGELNAYLVRKTWFERAHGDAMGLQIAYFSSEFGLHESLPIYSGGLGVLAGDHLKSASDLGLPLVGVGLLYRRGYFRQYLNRDGWQQELHPALRFRAAPAPHRDGRRIAEKNFRGDRRQGSGRSDLARPGGARAAAPARQRLAGERGRGSRPDGRTLRRGSSSPDPPGDPPRNGWGPGAAGDGVHANRLPHERRALGLHGARTDPAGDRAGRTCRSPKLSRKSGRARSSRPIRLFRRDTTSFLPT